MPAAEKSKKKRNANRLIPGEKDEKRYAGGQEES